MFTLIVSDQIEPFLAIHTRSRLARHGIPALTSVSATNKTTSRREKKLQVRLKDIQQTTSCCIYVLLLRYLLSSSSIPIAQKQRKKFFHLLTIRRRSEIAALGMDLLEIESRMGSTQVEISKECVEYVKEPRIKNLLTL